jgi:DNA-directed RNA polymerase specialized sigma24 family protein
MISKWEPNQSTPGEEAWRLGFRQAFSGHDFSEHDGELRRLVHRRLGERSLVSSPPKPLLQEACERLYEADDAIDDERWLTTARALRRVLVAEARRSTGEAEAVQRSLCRGTAGHKRGHRALEVLAVDRGLRALESLRPDLARLVELRYYGGLSAQKTAEILAVPRDSLAQGWRVARLYLRRWTQDTAW